MKDGIGRIHELIRKQIETNVRDGFCGPGTLDVVINDEWETLPCTYKDGMFTVTRGRETLGYRISIDLVSEGTSYP